jgi:hypothetical protein
MQSSAFELPTKLGLTAAQQPSDIPPQAVFPATAVPLQFRKSDGGVGVIGSQPDRLGAVWSSCILDPKAWNT